MSIFQAIELGSKIVRRHIKINSVNNKILYNLNTISLIDYWNFVMILILKKSFAFCLVMLVVWQNKRTVELHLLPQQRPQVNS